MQDISRSATETGSTDGSTWDRPVLLMDIQGVLKWVRLSTVCFAAGSTHKVVCHKSAIVDNYVTIEPLCPAV